MKIAGVLLVLVAATHCTQQPVREPVVYDYQGIYSGQGGHRFHPTVREECRSVLFDSTGRVHTIGVQSNATDLLNATRQFISLGRWEGDHWTSIAKVNERDGYVYSPAAVADEEGGIWIAWSEFNEIEQDFDVYARHWDGRGFGSVARLSAGRGPDLRPSIALQADGSPVVAWESARKGAVRIAVATISDSDWTARLVTQDEGFNFRPNLATAGDGTVWLAFDRWVDGDYDVMLRTLSGGNWSEETAFFASEEDEQRPMIRFAADGTAWIHASKRVSGVRGEQRFELPAEARDYVASMGSLDEFQIDASGRFWFLRQVTSFHPGNPGYRAGRSPASEGAWFDGETLQRFTLEVAIGYRAPAFDQGGYWHATDMMVYRKVIEPVTAAVRGDAVVGPVGETKAAKSRPDHVPHETLELDGETYTLYYGEMHTHLGEYPGDRTIEMWIDRYYMNAMESGVLDFGAASDHDWPSMTNSKYRVEQAYSNVLSEEGRFEGFASYEWSGDAAGRRRYGDRTIVFTRPFSTIYRITDPASNSIEELRQMLAGENAIPWVHHVGAPWGAVDWSKHDETAEPVVEITSGHGVYETYDKPRAVTDWLRRPPVGKTSIQDGLAAGKKFGFVGSSDRHDGISGYNTGMLAVFAKELSRESVLEALRARRTYAVRGGEPILLDFRVNGVFQGGEVESGGSVPSLSVKVNAESPVEKVEIVSNGDYIYTHVPDEETASSEFTYSDTGEPEPGTYYYVRVWLKGRSEESNYLQQAIGKYAWSSPVWLK